MIALLLTASALRALPDATAREARREASARVIAALRRGERVDLGSADVLAADEVTRWFATTAPRGA